MHMFARGALFCGFLAASAIPRVVGAQDLAPLRLRVAGVDASRCVSEADLRSGIAQVYGEAPFAPATAPALRELTLTVDRTAEGWRATIAVVDLRSGATASLSPLSAPPDRCAELQRGLVVAIWGWLQDDPPPPRATDAVVEPPPTVARASAHTEATLHVDAPVPRSPPRGPQPPTTTTAVGLRVVPGASLLIGVAPTVAPGVSFGASFGSTSWWFGVELGWNRALSDPFPARADVALTVDRGAARLRACGGRYGVGICAVVDGALLVTTTVSASRSLDAQAGALSVGAGVEATLPTATRVGATVRVDAMAALVAPTLRVDRVADGASVASWTSPLFWIGVTIGPSLRIR